MLEAKYYRDYRHNYMILRCGREAASRSYQYQILTSGKIGEILRCSVRHMNGTTYYYYDISSRTTLESLYRDKKMSGKQVKDLLWQLHGICGKLAGYFMEESALVLLPQHIYYDLANQNYIGLYYPDYQAQDGAVYRALMDFLLEHIDTEDRQLTEDMYRICENCEEPCFSIEDALQILEEEGPQRTELVEISTALYDAEDISVAGECSGQQYNGQTTGASLAYSEEYSRRDDEKESSIRMIDGKSGPRHSRIYPVCAAVAAFGMAGAYAVRSIYELTQEEEIVLCASMAVMAVCLALCLAGYFRKCKKNGTQSKGTGGLGSGQAATGKKNQEQKMPESVGAGQSTGYYEEPGEIPMEYVLDKDMNLSVAGSMSVSRRTMTAGQGKEPAAKPEPVTTQGNNACGNTVFFDTSRETECKLYAVDKKNKQHIELKQFPCTVGKMAGCVDYVLPDDSVSRIHARFNKEGEKVLLTDMNSTNGTYKNGLRMQPQETVEIEPGDEIRFGNLNYCYR